jgi:hypothetical protein
MPANLGATLLKAGASFTNAPATMFLQQIIYIQLF